MSAVVTHRAAWPPGERGFTMVEFLVSLAIMGLMAGMLLAGINGTMLLARRSHQMGSAGAEVSAAQLRLRESIEHIQPLRRAMDDPAVDVQGSDQVLNFSGPPAESSQPSSLRSYRLLLTGAGDLTLFSANALSDSLDLRAPSVVGWNGSPLIAGVTAISIAYYGAEPPDYDMRWRTFWQDRPSPPELVRIRVAFAAGDLRRWPDLVIRPSATTPPCTIDPITNRCKVEA